MRAPVAPRGDRARCRRRSGSRRPCARRAPDRATVWRTTDANASLTSITDVVERKPASSSAWASPGGPVQHPRRVDSREPEPDESRAWAASRGAPLRAPLTMRTAAAPSTICDEPPAVTIRVIDQVRSWGPGGEIRPSVEGDVVTVLGA